MQNLFDMIRKSQRFRHDLCHPAMYGQFDTMCVILTYTIKFVSILCAMKAQWWAQLTHNPDQINIHAGLIHKYELTWLPDKYLKFDIHMSDYVIRMSQYVITCRRMSALRLCVSPACMLIWSGLYVSCVECASVCITISNDTSMNYLTNISSFDIHMSYYVIRMWSHVAEYRHLSCVSIRHVCESDLACMSVMWSACQFALIFLTTQAWITWQIYQAFMFIYYIMSSVCRNMWSYVAGMLAPRLCINPACMLIWSGLCVSCVECASVCIDISNDTSMDWFYLANSSSLYIHMSDYVIRMSQHVITCRRMSAPRLCISPACMLIWSGSCGITVLRILSIWVCYHDITISGYMCSGYRHNMYLGRYVLRREAWSGYHEWGMYLGYRHGRGSMCSGYCHEGYVSTCCIMICT